MNNNNNKSNKPMCVLCNVPLYKMKEDQFQWRCPNQECRKVYQLYYEVMAYESDFSTIYGEEEENSLELAGLEGVGEPILLVAKDNDNDNDNEEEVITTKTKTKSDIPIPKYMKDSEITEVVEYREE